MFPVFTCLLLLPSTIQAKLPIVRGDFTNWEKHELAVAAKYDKVITMKDDKRQESRQEYFGLHDEISHPWTACMMTGEDFHGLNLFPIA
jgi:hypothetical protein